MIAKLSEPENALHWDNVIEKLEHSLNNTIYNIIKHNSIKRCLA